MPRRSSKKRECVITGNWKMYKTIEEAKQFVENVTPKLSSSQVKVCLAVPFTAIHPTAELVKKLGAPLVIGGQNMYDATEGAFTGEIAARMLLDAGATFVILGHSERRHIFHESSSFINKKVKRALKDGLTPVLCIGELDEERHRGETNAVLESQLEASLEGVSPEDLSKMILAYEPVWAIGTGHTATPDDAEKAHLFIREFIVEKWGKKIGNAIVIQYGGSVKPSNAQELLSQENVDGLLVGGASLDPTSFSEIVNSKDL
jgi:triosephosphate isomerase